MISQNFSLGYKRLSAVEVDPKASNQHEFQGVSILRSLFGDERITMEEVPMVELSDEYAPTKIFNRLTWYDARERNPDRSPEFRLVYSVPPTASPGDLLAIIRDNRQNEPRFAILIAEASSTWESQLLQVSGIDELKAKPWNGAPTTGPELRFESFTQSLFLEPILEILGWKEPVYEADKQWDPERLSEYFGGKFPSGIEISKYVYQNLSPKPDLTNIDSTLVRLYETERSVFFLLEKYFYGERIKKGFDEFDDFISLAKSITQSRRSRAGRALENHLEFIFQGLNINYSRGMQTENKKKPDFIFPSIADYRDTSFPSSRLKILGVKTSAKDRWRQVLDEADRIPEKHLLTLEPSISESQRLQMMAANLQLVIPTSINQLDLPNLPTPMSVENFVNSVL